MCWTSGTRGGSSPWIYPMRSYNTSCSEGGVEIDCKAFHGLPLSEFEANYSPAGPKARRPEPPMVSTRWSCNELAGQ